MHSTAVAAVCCAMFVRALVVAPASAGLPWVLLLGVGGGVAVIVEQLQRMVGSSAANAMTTAQASTRAAVPPRDTAEVTASPYAQPVLPASASQARTPLQAEASSSVAALATTDAQPVLRIREEDVDPIMAVDVQFDHHPVNPASVQRFGGYRQHVALLPAEEGIERADRGVLCTEAELEGAMQHAVEAALHDSNVKLKLQVEILMHSLPLIICTCRLCCLMHSLLLTPTPVDAATSSFQANFNTLLIVTGVVFFWRGTWTLLDGSLGDSAANAVLCCVAGLALVFGIRASKLPTASTFNEDL